MAASALSAPFFHDEAAAYAKLESLLWPHGPVCPKCGGLDRITPGQGWSDHLVSQQRLKRYLAKFDFRYNERTALGVEDERRPALALRGIVGKRLTYRDSSA
jgi:hypothetical protein